MGRPRKYEESRHVTARIPGKMADELDAIARKFEITRSEIIYKAIKNYLEDWRSDL